MATIFTKIIQGEIPCFKLYEDDETIAFLDINPVSPGHSLVVLKEEKATLEAASEAQAEALARAVRKVIKGVKAATGAPAVNLVVNDGPEAGQEIPHIHYHVIPRRPGDGLRLSWRARNPEGDLGALAASIAAAISA